LEEGRFNLRFRDDTGHWHTYPLNAEAIAHLQEGIDAETPLFDVKRLGVHNYEIDYQPEQWTELQIIPVGAGRRMVVGGADSSLNYIGGDEAV
jgi:hypothetical protein